MWRIVAAAVFMAAATAGVASANDPIPGPNAVGPFVGNGESTGKAVCEADMQAHGYLSSCYRFDVTYQTPQSSGQWFYDKYK